MALLLTQHRFLGERKGTMHCDAFLSPNLSPSLLAWAGSALRCDQGAYPHKRELKEMR